MKPEVTTSAATINQPAMRTKVRMAKRFRLLLRGSGGGCEAAIVKGDFGLGTGYDIQVDYSWGSQRRGVMRMRKRDSKGFSVVEAAVKWKFSRVWEE